MKKFAAKSAQSVIEYVLIMSVLLAAVLAVGFIGRVQAAFNTYFTNATTEITTNH